MLLLSKTFLSLLNESLYLTSIESSPNLSFEKFISFQGGFNEKYPEEKFHSFQFFKYHSFQERTAGNFPRIYYGNRREAKNITRINKYFKENGYITSYCGDLCQKDNARTLHNVTFPELYDHQMLLCDPNVVRYLIILNNSGENIKITGNFQL